jgi:hypothetical protein
LPIAFAEDGSVVVNFGILSGREATQAELDRRPMDCAELERALR